MKKFEDFINESLGKPLTGSASVAYSSSQYDILKKPKLEDAYSEIEFKVHSLMNKKPNLFCRVIKNSNERVLMEKLDTVLFSKDFDLYYDKFRRGIFEEKDEDVTIKLKNFMRACIDNDFHDNESDYDRCSTYLNNIEGINSYIPPFFIKYVNLKMEIFKFFKHSLPELRKSFVITDLHRYNFGYAKGTKEIRCFDPIYVVLLELEKSNSNIWECASGGGHISEVLIEHGHNVKSTDLINRN